MRFRHKLSCHRMEAASVAFIREGGQVGGDTHYGGSQPWQGGFPRGSAWFIPRAEASPEG
jgi:hypothetical protein